MVLQADPVLIRNEAGSGHLYSTESELRLPVRPHLMRIHPHQQLQVTCLSRVGYRSNILEGRSEWIVEPLTRTTPSWPSDPGGGVHQAVPAGTINSTLMGPVQGSSQDETAQSISDSEGPSRRTQPVVGSYPGSLSGSSLSILEDLFSVRFSFDATLTLSIVNGLHLFYFRSSVIFWLQVPSSRLDSHDRSYLLGAVTECGDWRVDGCRQRSPSPTIHLHLENHNRRIFYRRLFF